MSPFLLAAVAIVAIMAAVVVVTVKSLSSNPVRIAVVIIAFTGLVAALPPLFEVLRPPAPQRPAVRPSTPPAVVPSPASSGQA